MSFWGVLCGGAAIIGTLAYARLALMVFRRRNGRAWMFLRWHVACAAGQALAMAWSVVLRPEMFQQVTPDIGATALFLFGAALFGLLLGTAMSKQ